MDADHHRCQRCQLCAVDLEHGPCMRLSAARRQRGGDPAGLACRMRARPGWPWRTSALCWLAIHAAWRRARLGDACWALKISSRTVPVAGWCAGSGKAMSGSWRLAVTARPRSGAAARTGPPRPTGRLDLQGRPGGGRACGYPHPASRSGQSGLQDVPQPVRLQEHRVVNRGQVKAGGVTDGLS